MALIHSQQLNPCTCGSKELPVLDSDDMVPSWNVACHDCGKYHHDEKWTFVGAVREWNKNNPITPKGTK